MEYRQSAFDHFRDKLCESRRRLRKTMGSGAVVIASLVCLAAVCPSIAHGEASPRPFGANSPWNQGLSGGAVVDPNSAAMVARMSRDNAMYANLVEYAIPIFYASGADPRHSVGCSITEWGKCPFDGFQVPIPSGAGPNSGSDGAMVIIDESTRQVFEFWQARNSGGRWTTSWGAVNSLDGSGWGGNSTGSGASRLGGVIRVADIAQGMIPHALAVQTDSICAGTFRPPAIKTDGRSSRPDCIPEGARIRLDPALDLGSLGLAPGVLTVARALQDFGAYVVDGGGAPLSISFELDQSAGGGSAGSVYQQAGLHGDYDPMQGIPYDRLQVLS